MYCGIYGTVACLGMPRGPQISGGCHAVFKDSPFEPPSSQPYLKHTAVQVT